MNKNNYGRFKPNQGGHGKDYGKYNPDALSIEKYNGGKSTLALYCSEYSGGFPKDWVKEDIPHSEANTSYAMNVLKSYAYGDNDNKTIACYCGLYMFKHAKRLGYKCDKTRVWVKFKTCVVEFCTRSGIKCNRKDNCDNTDSSWGWFIVSFPFLLVILLIIVALSRRR